MKILYKFASRSRPEKFFACLDNITSLSRHDDYEILCSFDLDDTTMANEKIRDKLKEYPKVTPYWGNSKNKIQAINRDLEFAGSFDILLNHSDDMIFFKEGYDLSIINAFKKSGPDVLIHFPDQKAGHRLITYAMMDKPYFDRFGYIYNPEYISVYADHEQQDVAKLLGRYRFVPEKILEHRHAIWGYGAADELLKSTENPINYKIDHQTYLRRRSKNFINSPTQ